MSLKINIYLAVRFSALMLTFLLYSISTTQKIHAQKKLKQDDKILRYSVGILNCESARRNIEMMIEKVDKPTEANIFAIIRLAKNERSNVYTPRKIALDRILQRLYKSVGGEYIVAESDRTNERNGRIEFYVQGQLYMIYETAPNISRICSN